MSDNNLIRRADALAVVRPTGERPCDCRGCRGSLPTAEDWARWDAFSRAAAAIEALPAVTVGVKPLRYFFAQGETVDQVREHAQAHPLAKEGDMKLVWVNEGDLYDHSIFLAALEPVAAPDPAAIREAALRVTGKALHDIFVKRMSHAYVDEDPIELKGVCMDGYFNLIQIAKDIRALIQKGADGG